MDKYIGRLLDNRYEILEVIGNGGMAVVYKARCHRLNRLVAIKILKDDFLEDEEFRRRFHSESQAVAMLSHPNIVNIYDVSTSLEADYIVMELIDGITLKQYMEKKGVLNWKETLHFAMQIAKALEHAHGRGIVHRDIKPHNVMVLKNGSVKVTDFGIARVMSKGNTLTKEALGSVHYISPEQAKGGRVDNRSDIYSLGVVLYEMMSGRPPYDGDSPVAVAIQHINGGAQLPSTLNPNIPGGLEQIIMKAMAHEITERYTSATKMLADLDEFRKNPSMLFEYNLPPIDTVTTLKKPATVAANPEVKTAAERAAERVEERRKRSGTSVVPIKKPQTTPTPAPRRRRQEAQPKRNNIAVYTIVICSITIIAALLILLFLGFSGGFFKSERLVEVPDLVGKEFDSLPSYSNFEIYVNDRVYDETVPEGRIISQNPNAGEMIAKGNRIVVVISMGNQPKDAVPMKNLVGWTKDKAIEYLESLSMNFEYSYIEDYNNDIPDGSVVSTKPEVDTDLNVGDKITLTISKGPKIVPMPNVMGMTVTSATQVLMLNGFVMPKIEMVDSAEDPDTVVGQSVPRDEKISVTTEITLQVSKGPAPVEDPKVTVNHTITKLPVDHTEAYTLTIQLDDETVYETQVEPGITEWEVKLTGYGTKYYKILINGEAFRIEEVRFPEI